MEELARLLQGLSVYQDIALPDGTARRGVRDGESRWKAIAPHLPPTGTLLDIGANFGWFPLRWCAEGADRVAAAVEADLRSAAVQRFLLQAHDEHRIALLTAKAGAAMVRRFEQTGQRFDAVLCLSVLHWIREHRAMLAGLGRIADRIFIEQPDPREAGAGDETIRREIGEIGPYLKELLPEHRVERIATWTAHLSELPRELWMVSAAERGQETADTASLDAAALLDLDVAWPPRAWWQRQIADLPSDTNRPIQLTTDGLRFTADAGGGSYCAPDWSAAVNRIPDKGVTTIRRRVRRLMTAVRRRLLRV